MSGDVHSAGLLARACAHVCGAGEANFVHDPEAAQAVLVAGFKSVVLADLGVTHQTDICTMRERVLKEVPNSTVATMIYHIVRRVELS